LVIDERQKGRIQEKRGQNNAQEHLYTENADDDGDEDDDRQLI